MLPYICTLKCNSSSIRWTIPEAVAFHALGKKYIYPINITVILKQNYFSVMKYIVNCSKNKNDSKLNLHWSEIWNEWRRFDLLLNLLIMHWPVTTTRPICTLRSPIGLSVSRSRNTWTWTNLLELVSAAWPMGTLCPWATPRCWAESRSGTDG